MGQNMSVSSVESMFPDVKTMAEKIEMPNKNFSYGTAGFRDNASILDGVLFRTGILACLRSIKTGMNIGIVVTASHNPEHDNGVKIVDPDGGMLDRSWEAFAEALANSKPNQIYSVIADICDKEGINKKMFQYSNDKNRIPTVLLARDTRQSGEHLMNLAMKGVKVLGGNPLNFGLLTTPQLHHCVRMSNGVKGSGPFWGKVEWEGEIGYYKMICEAYGDLVNKNKKESPQRRHSFSWFGIGPCQTDIPTQLYIDCSNGIGANKILKLQSSLLANNIQFNLEIRNDGLESGKLNFQCGAEHAQKLRLPPMNFSSKTDIGKRCCSLDGDVDRVVYHYFDTTGRWNLIDGDKMAALVALFLQDELIASGLFRRLTFSVVQTAYANGASTSFLSENEIKVVRSATGVKFLHHEALKYDIGVYFEANGHGTVLFRDSAVQTLLSRKHELVSVEEPVVKPLSPNRIPFFSSNRARRYSEEERLASAAQYARKRKILAVDRLLQIRQLVNQAVGDALSDILLAEAILHIKKWNMDDWNCLYTDLPSRQAKLRVKDRSVVKCTADERKALTPIGLQARLEKESFLLKPPGRCFVRPSGTEDYVRIYAEASTQIDADALALAAMQAVYELAGGVGENPSTCVPLGK